MRKMNTLHSTSYDDKHKDKASHGKCLRTEEAFKIPNLEDSQGGAITGKGSKSKYPGAGCA